MIRLHVVVHVFTDGILIGCDFEATENRCKVNEIVKIESTDIIGES